jgi:hypothetical protein
MTTIAVLGQESLVILTNATPRAEQSSSSPLLPSTSNLSTACIALVPLQLSSRRRTSRIGRHTGMAPPPADPAKEPNRKRAARQRWLQKMLPGRGYRPTGPTIDQRLFGILVACTRARSSYHGKLTRLLAATRRDRLNAELNALRRTAFCC